jgi:hypothetical protein
LLIEGVKSRHLSGSLANEGVQSVNKL